MSDDPNRVGPGRNCRLCVHRRPIPGDEHSSCAAPNPHVTGERFGIMKGWFHHPYNFDPLWLRSCDSFEPKKEQS